MAELISDRADMHPTFTVAAVPEARAPQAEGIVQAASLALAILRSCANTPTWSALMEAVEAPEPDETQAKRAAKFAELLISDEQWQLLSENRQIVHSVGVRPQQSIACCLECGEWFITGEGTTPARCTLSNRCEAGSGSLVKAVAAKRTPNTREDEES